MFFNKTLLGQKIEMICGVLLGVELLWVPVPLASMPRFSMGLLIMFSALIFLLLNVGLLLQGRNLSINAFISPPLVFMYLYSVLLFFQAGQIYRQDLSIWMPVSTDVYSTKIQLLFTCALIFNFITLNILCSSWERIRTFLMVVVLLGSYQAILGMYLYGIEANYQFIYFPVNHGNRMTGSYGNPNHFAGLMEICLSVTLGLMLTYFSNKKQTQVSLKEQWVGYFFGILSKKFFLRLVVVLMFVALLLSESRMGNAGFMMALILTLLISAFLMRNWSKKIAILLISILVIDAFLIGQMIGVEKVVNRIQETSATKARRMSQESLEERLVPSSRGIEIVKNRPLFGYGAGAFYATFSHFNDPMHIGYFDHAHNDYVEVLIETGWTGFLLLGGLAITLLYSSVRLMGASSVKARGMGVIGVMATSALLIHAGVDFNFHITANVLIYMFVYTICWTFYQKHVKWSYLR